MKITHVAMYVKNLEKIKKFYEMYFNATSNEKYHNIKTGLETYFLTFSEGTKLEIMAHPDTIKTDKNLRQDGYIHLAFSVGNKEKVNELTEILRKDGYHILSGPRTTGDGFYESCILDCEGNQVEITE